MSNWDSLEQSVIQPEHFELKKPVMTEAEVIELKAKAVKEIQSSKDSQSFFHALVQLLSEVAKSKK